MAAKNDDVFLHGDLYLTIFKARKLRRLKVIAEVANSIGMEDICIALLRQALSDIPCMRITVRVAGAEVARTGIKCGLKNFVWNEHCKIPLAHLDSKVSFEVLLNINDGSPDRIIGVAAVSAQKIATGELIDEWLPVVLALPYAIKIPISGTIHVRMKFTPCSGNPTYSDGVEGLNESYYPLRRVGKVTLYQDAHVTDGMLPEIELDDNIHHEHGKCWVDICHAISEAKNIVYLVGWSIHQNINLVQPTPGDGDLNLGELLKRKSESGVRVRILLWNDSTRQMKTRCSETLEFFNSSSVTCLLVPRNHDMIKDILYTHHQKCVIVDTHRDENSRKITAFIGGLDLCAGRFDTPNHQLFPEPNYAFQDYNPNFNKGVMCPRQPWHDLHCRIEGPAAYDVLENFQQRWNRVKKPAYDTLLKIEIVSEVISSSSVSQEDDPENWHVQIFRSINSRSVDNFPKDAHEVDEQNLVIGKQLVATDRSIQMAYIQAIRSARHHIYIENQYFIGSSYAWPSNTDAGANNLIPMELTQKIISKIRANERFTVYVVIPMWPEGVPTSLAVQEILYWQRHTMEMIYKSIADELKSLQRVDAHPTDYLNFYCLGNREMPPEDSIANGNHSSNGRNGMLSCIGADDWEESASQKYGRFMIYVHSKGMIVDDEYVILGSANINERSMSGSRDTEIAMGAYQPRHTWAKNMNHPRGQVYGYRMSLWAEHLGTIDDCFKNPKNLDCVNEVNRVAEDNWRKYTAKEFTPLRGHILKYPIQVEDDGKINSLPGHETFPDVGGKILGSRTNLPTRLPSRLTT